MVLVGCIFIWLCLYCIYCLDCIYCQPCLLCKFLVQETCIIRVTHSHYRILYQKLAPMHGTKIVRLDWSAVFESYRYKKLAPNRAAFYSVQVSGTRFSSVCHLYKLASNFWLTCASFWYMGKSSRCEIYECVAPIVHVAKTENWQKKKQKWKTDEHKKSIRFRCQSLTKIVQWIPTITMHALTSL